MLIFLLFGFVSGAPLCSELDFQCGTGACISFARRWDGFPDCEDESDETDLFKADCVLGNLPKFLHKDEPVKSGYRNGDTINITCPIDDDYSYEYSVEEITTKLTCSNGRWHGHIPECIEGDEDLNIKSTPMTNVDAVTITSEVNATQHSLAEYANYTPTETGKAPNEETTIRPDTGNNDTTDEPYANKAVQCQPLKPPENGWIEQNKDSHDRTSNDYGSYARIRCEEGYQLTGTVHRHCQADGTWSGVDSICRRKQQCLSNILNPFLSDSSKAKESYQTGETIFVACPADSYYYYGQDGEKTQSKTVVLSCTDGKWIGHYPECFLNCTKPEIDAILNPEYDSYAPGDKVTVTECKMKTAKVEGDPELVCKADGTWIGSASCPKVNCTKPEIDAILNPEYDSYAPGDKVTVTECKMKTAKVEGDQELVCKADGTWIGSASCPNVPPSVRAAQREYSAQQNSVVELRCEFTGVPEPTVQWDHESGELPLQHSIKDGVLTIYKVQPANSGRYICTATNAAGTARDYVFLTVASSPVINGGETRIDTHTVDVGDRVEIECIITGTPLPTILWSRDDGPLPASAILGDGIMIIPDARLEDAGTYTCTAVNQAGSVQSKVVLYVRAKVDLVFILDASSSVTEPNYRKMLTFCKDFLRNADIDSGNVRVGVVIYSTDVAIQFHLNRYSIKTDLFAAIDKIPYIYGATNTADGLKVMRTEMFTLANGDRPDIDNIAVIITDGISNINSRRTIPEAVQARAMDIHIYAIGIGLSDRSELDAIASEPAKKNSFSIKEFDELVGLETKIFTSICLGRPRTPTPTTPKPTTRTTNAKCYGIPNVPGAIYAGQPRLQYHHGTIISYNCVENYILTGINHFTCVDGNWMDGDFNCTRPVCDLSQLNLRYGRFHDEGRTIVHGDSVSIRETVKCQDGYTVPPNISYLSCYNGILDPPNFDCIEHVDSVRFCHLSKNEGTVIRYRDKCYLATKSTFIHRHQQARRYCQNLGSNAYLATIPDKETNEAIRYLMNMVPGEYKYWFGAMWNNPNSRWEWHDGTPLNYANWKRGEGGMTVYIVKVQYCAIMTSDGRWEDTICQNFGITENKYKAICEIAANW